MIIHLDFHQKLVGLSLLKLFSLEQASKTFSRTMDLRGVNWIRQPNIKNTLLDLRKRHLLLQFGILEKHENGFHLHTEYETIPVNDSYINFCPDNRQLTLKHAMQILQERHKGE
jgi:hypothetical protein